MLRASAAPRRFRRLFEESDGDEVPHRPMLEPTHANSGLPPAGRPTSRRWRGPCLAIALAAATVALILASTASAAATREGPSLAAASIDRSASRRVDRLVRDLADRAERAVWRRKPESEETLLAWLLPRLAEIGVDPSSLAARGLERHSPVDEADATIRLSLLALADAVPPVEPADVPTILRSRPEYPPNPAAAPDLIRRLAGAPAIATLRPRRAPSLADRLLALEAAHAEVEPRRLETERLRERIRTSLETIPGELGAAALVLADLEDLAALAHRGWPTSKAKRRVAKSIDEIAEIAGPGTIEFLLQAIDAMPEVSGRCVQRVERRGDGGLRLEFARSSIGESDRQRWRERLGGRKARRLRATLTRPEALRRSRARSAAASRAPSPSGAAPGRQAAPGSAPR